MEPKAPVRPSGWEGGACVCAARSFARVHGNPWGSRAREAGKQASKPTELLRSYKRHGMACMHAWQLGSARRMVRTGTKRILVCISRRRRRRRRPAHEVDGGKGRSGRRAKNKLAGCGAVRGYWTDAGTTATYTTRAVAAAALDQPHAILRPPS
ncbi:hypothetical protein IWZ03DRAFT_54789 [Phyllosticta citriasiana]|uniref:Uncharacterized protein n=1 Tax=Phyllosticta citriasiana TaxID=595635 RepID=A0ABR1KEN9_9PEZI